MTSRAVILAAGRGVRLAPITDEVPKPLIPVAGRPILVHIIDGLLEAGMRDLAIVTGYRGEVIEQELGNGGAVGVSIAYLHQDSLDGTASALALARDFVGDEPFLYSWGDILVRPPNYRNVLRASRLSGASLAVNHVDDPTHGAAVYVDDDSGNGLVERVIEKPAPGTSMTNWNAAGFGVLPPAIWPLVDTLQPSHRGEYELSEAIGALVESGSPVRAVPVEGPWFDIGTHESLQEARATFEGRQ